MKINSGKKARARRVLIYGENGVGKSSIAAQFPKPLFLNLEDGIGDLDVDSTDIIRDFGTFFNLMIEVSSTDYETIVVDTADWLERLIFNDVAAKAGKKTIDDIGFGKGYQSVALQWALLFDGFAFLWNQGRHIVFTCHETIEKFTNPEGDSYNYWRPSLHLKGSGCVTEWCDEVLFLRYKTSTIQKDEGFGNKRAIAIGGKDRVIQCSKTAGCEAKNRLGMPDEIPLTFDAISRYLPKVEKTFSQQPVATVAQQGNIAGFVIDGSSKQKSSVECVESVTSSPF